MKPGEHPPEDLRRLQRWFQAVVTHPAGVSEGLESPEARALLPIAPEQVDSVVTSSRAMSPAERMSVYANAYYARLLECLGDVYPMMKRALGDETFEAFAYDYLQHFPSTTYTLNDLGKSFPDYLEQSRPSEEDAAIDASEDLDGSWPDFLIDLARLEWGIYDVFDGEGVEGQSLLQTSNLSEIPESRWEDLQFRFVPCFRLLATRFPVNDYFTLLRNSEPEEEVPFPEPVDSFIALTRRDYVVRRYSVSELEFHLLQSLHQGASLGEAIERLTSSREVQMDSLAKSLQLWFRNWTGEGFFHSVHLRS